MMNVLPETKGSYRHLWQMLMNSISSQLLLNGLRMGIFDKLKSFTSSSALADNLGSHLGNTEVFLNALTTVGLLEKKNGYYRNSPNTQSFLVRGVPYYLGGVMQFVQQMCIDPLSDLQKLVMEGPMPVKKNEDFKNEKFWAESTRNSAAWAAGHLGETIAGIVSQLEGFENFEKMLDLGGGHGLFALYLINAHPDMQGVIFDRPAITRVTTDFIRQYGMQKRACVVSGDYLLDDIGSDYDIVWASSTLNFAKLDLDPLISKIFNSLNPGGYFISLQDGMTHEHTQPDVMLSHLFAALQSGMDFSFDQGFIAKSMLRAGFKTIRSRTIETPMGIVDLDIARKE
jgi:SAM-dependent methyltransferase